MLQAVLSGVRDVRAPLASGYLWLLSLYLAVVRLVPDRHEASGVVKDLYSLVEAPPVSAVLAASVFIAYLVGAAAEGLTEALVKVTTRLAIRVGDGLERLGSDTTTVPEGVKRNRMQRVGAHLQRWAGTRNAALSLRGEYAVEALAEHRIRRIERVLDRESVTSLEVEQSVPIGRALLATDPASLLFDIAETREVRERSPDWRAPAIEEDVANEVIAELERSKQRLLAAAPDLHAEVDRVEGEAALRLAIVPPLAALVCIVALRDTGWWLALLPLLVIFWSQGIRRRQERGDRVVDALVLGLIDSPYLEQLDATVTETVEDAKLRRVSASRRRRALGNEESDGSDMAAREGHGPQQPMKE